MKQASVQFVTAFLLSFAILFCHSCPSGYYGNNPQCTLCQPSTYKGFAGNAQACTPCPLNSGHSKLGSVSVADCKCFTGYNGAPQRGIPCVIRSCVSLVPRRNGVIVGNCNHQYLSVCRFQCNEGYESSGSVERRCIVSSNNVMEWSGLTTQCFEIQCPFRVVLNADPPSGVCTDPSLVYQTRCTYQCRTGYKLIGPKEHVCQLDKTWSGGSTVCEKITCPPLQPVQFARYSPAECSTVATPAFRVCDVLCHEGFQIKGPNYLGGLSLLCQPDGSWDNQLPQCYDFRSPELVCPNNMYVDTTKGSAFAEVLWSVDVSDNSFAVDPNAKVIVRSNFEPPYKFAIGSHYVNVNATDSEGNVAWCSFVVDVKDREPPTCSSCPSDIHLLEVKGSQERVNWDMPQCSDNSGLHVIIQSNYRSGDNFFVPGTYHVQYTIGDADGNSYEGCSFKITLKKAACPMYPPPKNGALVCLNSQGTAAVCQVACKDGTDFVVNPSFVYICSRQEWVQVPFPASSLPWPDCASGAGPSMMKSSGFSMYFFDGNQSPAAVEAQLKQNFEILGKSNIFSFCSIGVDCNPDNVVIYV